MTTTTATCRHCHRRILQDDEGRWVDPEATGDDSVWRETCEGHDTFAAEHEPVAPRSATTQDVLASELLVGDHIADGVAWMAVTEIVDDDDSHPPSGDLVVRGTRTSDDRRVTQVIPRDAYVTTRPISPERPEAS